MSKFQFKIVTGADEAACQTKYDTQWKDSNGNHDPYTFYLFEHGGIGYLGDTQCFGGGAINKSTETQASFVSKVNNAITTVTTGGTYDPTDSAGDNLSGDKLITESQLADILVHLLKDYVQYSTN